MDLMGSNTSRLCPLVSPHTCWLSESPRWVLMVLDSAFPPPELPGDHRAPRHWCLWKPSRGFLGTCPVGGPLTWLCRAPVSSLLWVMEVEWEQLRRGPKALPRRPKGPHPAASSRCFFLPFGASCQFLSSTHSPPGPLPTLLRQSWFGFLSL